MLCIAYNKSKRETVPWKLPSLPVLSILTYLSVFLNTTPL